MSIFRESIIPRACLIQGAREIVDSGKLYVINKTGGSNSNNDLISSYLPNKSEILDNNSNLTAYHRTDDQKNTAAEVKSTAEGTAQSQRMQSANSGYMLNGKSYDKTVANEKNRWVFDSTLGDGSNRGKPNDGYPDYSFASRWTEMQGVLKGGGNVNRLNAEGNTLWDSVSQGVEDIVQSEAVRLLSVNGMDERWPSEEEWEDILKKIKELNVRQLTGTAAKIMSILSVVMPNPGIATLHILLGLCVVAQEVQEARRKEKERLEGLNSPEWNEAAIKAELDRQVPIWFRNKAMEFFVGEWLGKVTKFITTDKLKRVMIDQGREPFLDYYKRMLMAWNEYQEILDARSQIDTWTGIIENAYKNQGNSGEY